MRVLITGGAGLLGGRLSVLLGRRFSVIAGRHRTAPPTGVKAVPLDITDETSLRDAFASARPQAVLHCAANADGDACERDPAGARVLNVEATDAIARLCVAAGARLIALSTDLVLSGRQATSDETAAPYPLLEYARTKLGAERAVLDTDPAFVVFRVALVVGRGFGARGTGSETIVWGMRDGGAPRLFTDQFRTPVDAESVAEAVASVLAGRGRGLYNMGGPERVSRFELGQRTAAACGLDTGRLVPARAGDQMAHVPRPADCSLDVSRARRDLGWEPRPLDAALRESRESPG